MTISLTNPIRGKNQLEQKFQNQNCFELLRFLDLLHLLYDLTDLKENNVINIDYIDDHNSRLASRPFSY